MDEPITFTLGQIIAAFLSFCGGISVIGAAVGWIVKAINAAKAPQKKQTERMDALEIRIKDLEIFSKSDKARLDDIEEGNRVTQRAILALLSHGIDGNDLDSMKKAKQELTDYLTER